MSPQSSPKNDDQQPKRTLKQRWRSLVTGVRMVPGWVMSNPKLAALVLGACLVSVGSLALGWFVIVWLRPAVEPATLEAALEKLDQKQYLEAREMAERLRQQQDTLPIDELGGPPFVLGAIAAHEADDTWSNDKTLRYMLARRYLEEARDRSFPPGREAEGMYLLGKSLYLSGRIPASRPVLLAALEMNEHRKTDIHRLLAGAYLNDANPKLEEALAENSLCLADPRLPRSARDEGLLQRARILFELDKISECIATLGKIPADSRHRAEAMILWGQFLMHEGKALKSNPQSSPDDVSASRQKYLAAIKTLRTAQGHDTLRSLATRKTMYLIGVCYVEMEDYQAALGQFSRTSKLYKKGAPEALAADFQQAEVLRELGRDTEAMAGYRLALSKIIDPKNFSNPWITLDELRTGMLAVYKHYLEAEKFEIALQLTRHFYPLFSRVRTLDVAATGYQAWGRVLLDRATTLPHKEAGEVRRSGYTQLRQAGRVYSRLAKLQIATGEYHDRLWASASSYFDGHDYANTIRVLEKYLRDHTRQRHPRALVQLGESKLALNRVDEALESFQECVEFHPRDAAAYRARLLASRAYLERDDLRQAEDLLNENLNGEWLTPASREWRDSLFALGDLLHIKRDYQAAAGRLEEAVTRYPDAPASLHARYLIADSYRQSANANREALKSDQQGTNRAARTRQIFEAYDKALARYQEVREMLARRQETHELLAMERTILRNCYFATGDILFDMGRYEAAIKSYGIATNRYQNDPEVLEAYVQIANAYRRMNKLSESRSTLEQAKVVLGRMKPEAPFEKTTNYTHDQWKERLAWLAEL